MVKWWCAVLMLTMASCGTPSAVPGDPPDIQETDDVADVADVAKTTDAAPDVAPAPPEDVPPPEPEPDPCLASDALLDRMSPDRMLADMQFLVGLGERATWESQHTAADYIEEQLSGLDGLTITRHEYTMFGNYWHNVEVTLAGSELPEEYVLAGAHVDSTSEKSMVDSPGADDDASGVATLMETARALAGCAPKRSVRLLFFSNEELGTVGSEEYVKTLKTELPPEQVLAYINVDMIAYGPDDEDLDLATKPQYGYLVEAMATIVEQWTDLEVVKHIDDHCG